MTTEEIRLKAYNTIKQQLDAAFSQGGIPNIKQFRKTIKDLKRRIGILIDGTELFARSEEDVEKAARGVANLSGQLEAYQERYDWIMRKLKENA